MSSLATSHCFCHFITTLLDSDVNMKLAFCFYVMSVLVAQSIRNVGQSIQE